MHSPKSLLAALALLPLLAAAPAHSEQPIAISGPYTLTQSEENDDLAIWQLVAGRPLALTDREAVQAVDVSLFRRDPAWLLANLRQCHNALPRLRRSNAVDRAGLRETNLTDLYCTPEKQHLTPSEAAQIQAVISRYVPVVNVDKASGTVVTERDLEAWQAAARLVAAQTHTPPQATHAVMLKLLQAPQFSKAARVKAANMERSWAAYQLCWAHEPAADRRGLLSRITHNLHQSAAQGQTGLAQAGSALLLASSAAGDYPYSLDPRFAVLKYKLMGMIQANTAMIMDQAIRENGRIMRNGVQERAGQGPLPGDEGPAQYHPPIMP